MRLRALPALLVLTAADYALWRWSIADGHDVVSLVAGLTLLPLAAATLAMLAVGAARLVSVALERPAARRRLTRRATIARDAANRRQAPAAAPGAPGAATAAHPAEQATRGPHERSSRRLAA